MESQINIGIDAASGNIVVSIGPGIGFAMSPCDALKFMAGLTTILAQHPQLQPRQERQILVAGYLPQLAGGIDLGG